jgi:hypothetical protein
MLKNFCILIFLSLFFCCHTCGPKEKLFIITQKPIKKTLQPSRNNLKEKLGQEFKNIVEGNILLEREIGLFQIAFAKKTQETSKLDEPKSSFQPDIKILLSTICSIIYDVGSINLTLSLIKKILIIAIERLIDNCKPFKKANKKDLQETIRLMDTVVDEVKILTTKFKNFTKNLQKHKPTKKEFLLFCTQDFQSKFSQNKNVLNKIYNQIKNNLLLKNL